MNNKNNGFTLLEILIALFVFAIVSLMMVSALHNILNNQSRVEQRSKSFAELQLALLLLENDLEQTINRPILNAHGDQEAAFLGDATNITFTHTGLSNPFNQLHRSTLQRVSYQFSEKKLTRVVWPVLDQAPHTQSSQKLLLNDISDLRFTFMDQENHFQKEWPPTDKQKTSLPRAVQISFTLKSRGKITQFYLIPVQILPPQNESQNPKKADDNANK